MDGRDIAKPAKKIRSNLIIPLYFEFWNHLSQSGADLEKDLSNLVLLKKYVGYIPELGRLLT